MSLASVTRGRSQAPDRILLSGTEGIGKSTFGADSNKPIFIAAEDGLRRLDVAKFPEPETFEDVLAAIDVLINGEHEYRTLVVDTVDWLEPLVWKSVCKKNGWTDIESPGYGKGYTAALDTWRLFLSRLDQLRNKRGVEIILLGHTGVTTFQNPAGADYSRYELQINKKAAALLKQWTDVNLFAAHEDFTTDKKKGTVKGVSSGQRIVHTERTPAWDAKNRYGLPPTLPLSYLEYAAARAKGIQADPGELLAECLELADLLKQGPEAPIRGYLEANKDDAVKLAKALNTLRVKAAEAGAQESANAAD